VTQKTGFTEKKDEDTLVVGELEHGTTHTTIWPGTREDWENIQGAKHRDVGHQGPGRQERLRQVKGRNQSGEAEAGEGN